MLEKGRSLTHVIKPIFSVSYGSLEAINLLKKQDDDG